MMRTPTSDKRIAIKKRRTTMKTFASAKNINGNAMKLVLGVLIATFLCAAAAQAQPAFSGKFVLPNEVRWNHTVLPAGEYFIQMDSLAAPAVVRSTSSGKQIYTAQPMIVESEKSPTQLNITVLGNERVVRSLNLPGIDRALIFEPLTKAERESIAKAKQSETVPVVTARK
jgi:hypothetical protein